VTDREFAVAAAELLERAPTGTARDNAVTYACLQQALEDANEVMMALKDLVDGLYRGALWFENPRLTVPLLHALYVLQEQCGSSFVWGSFIRGDYRGNHRTDEYER
jgi:hypothetical protein